VFHGNSRGLVVILFIIKGIVVNVHPPLFNAGFSPVFFKRSVL
jgi:hypothetical protein